MMMMRDEAKPVRQLLIKAGRFLSDQLGPHHQVSHVSWTIRHPPTTPSTSLSLFGFLCGKFPQHIFVVNFVAVGLCARGGFGLEVVEQIVTL
jgi:hypothetical protein